MFDVSLHVFAESGDGEHRVFKKAVKLPFTPTPEVTLLVGKEGRTDVEFTPDVVYFDVNAQSFDCIAEVDAEDVDGYLAAGFVEQAEQAK